MFRISSYVLHPRTVQTASSVRPVRYLDVEQVAVQKVWWGDTTFGVRRIKYERGNIICIDTF